MFIRDDVVLYDALTPRFSGFGKAGATKLREIATNFFARLSEVRCKRLVRHVLLSPTTPFRYNQILRLFQQLFAYRRRKSFPCYSACITIIGILSQKMFMETIYSPPYPYRNSKIAQNHNGLSRTSGLFKVFIRLQLSE